MEVNQCDLNCPRKAFLAAEYREDSANAGALRKLTLAAAVGARGVEQVARAATCPQRNLPAEQWQPRQECVDAVQDAQAERPLDLAGLNDYEQRVLRPYIEPNPPAPEG
ncbi:MAG TPA: hypothetical protein VJ836_05830 [Candidatus Saccharimonadales bacterium]|nr:hypothetical protein [Candidatus Saccharimonadales bacterium]